VENLKSALRNLDQKLAEANAKADLLIAQHRRARAANRASDAQSGMSANSKSATFDRMKRKVAREEAWAKPSRKSGRGRRKPPCRPGKRRPRRAVTN